MCGIGRYQLELLLMAKQLLLAHDPQYALMVNRIAAIPKFCCDPPVAVIRKLQSYLLNLIIQIQIIIIICGDRLRSLQPLIVAAATYFKRLAERDAGN